MFDKDFYPTPDSVIDIMLIEAQKIASKHILEPQAGKGSIVDKLRILSPKSITVCEKNEELAKIAASKADRFLKPDFLKVTSEEVSHIDLIIMNPPFSSQTAHISHAVEICPPGCQIISLCNSESYNPYRSTLELSQLRREIKENGSFTELGSCFDNAERKTNVSVGLISYFKPSEGEDEFKDLFDLDEEYQGFQSGILKYDVLKDMISRYIGAVKMFDEVESISKKINNLAEPFDRYSCIEFGAYQKRENNYREITRETYKKDLQKSAWKTIFSKLKMEKYVTKKVLELINKFVEKQENVPFTLNNVYKMLYMIEGTHESRMKGVVLEIFDELTKHTHENRFEKEGWKTNSEYMVNQKFIINWGGVSIQDSNKWSSRYDFEKMNDLNKAMCFITGTPFEHCENWETWTRNTQDVVRTRTVPENYDFPKEKWGEKYEIKDRKPVYREFGKWHKWGFFTIKAFKKGTLHVKFNSEDHWIMFNKIAAQAKGFQLASKFTSDFRSKETGVRVKK